MHEDFMFEWKLDDIGTNLAVCVMKTCEKPEQRDKIASCYIWKDDLDERKYYFCWFYEGIIESNVPFARGFRTEDTGGLAMVMRDAEEAWLKNHGVVMQNYLIWIGNG